MARTNPHLTHLKNAFTWADDQSYAERRKVGAFVVKDGQVLSQGHNGTLSGFDNRCEDESGLTYNKHVNHAEANALDKMARSTSSAEDAIMYCTDSPCGECAKRMVSTRIKQVYFVREYHDLSGLDLLITAGVDVFRVNLEDTEDKSIQRLGFFDTSYFRLGIGQFNDYKMDRSLYELFNSQVRKAERIFQRFSMRFNDYKLEFMTKDSGTFIEAHTFTMEYDEKPFPVFVYGGYTKNEFVGTIDHSKTRSVKLSDIAYIRITRR